MTTILTALGAGIVAIGIGIATLFGYSPQPQLAATIPVTPAVFSTSLATSITSTATSMTLVSGTDKAGTALSGYICFTLDEGTSLEEFACGTASSTAVTAMIRGVDPIDGDLEVTALKKAHRRGASVKVTTYPITGILARILNGDETIPNAISYATSTAGFITSAAQLTHKAYVDGVAVAGASNADTSTKGIVEIATTAEVASGTTTGGTGAVLVPPASMFSSTTASLTLVPVTQSTGKLKQAWLDLTEVFSFSAISSASTTLSGNTYFASTTRFASIASSSVLVSGGSGATVGVAPSTSGMILKSDGTNWVSGFPAPTSVNSGNTTITANTTTLVATLSGHRAGATVFAACGVQNATNNQTFTFTLSSSGTFSTGSAPSCAIGSGTGGAGGCALNAVVTNTTATSTTFSIQNSHASQGAIGHCAAYTIN